MERVADEVRSAGGRPFVVAVGGTGPVGAAGQVLAGLELADQLAAAGVGEATVVLPSATGGTHAGLLTGLALAAPPTRPSSGSRSPRRRPSCDRRSSPCWTASRR